MIEIEICSKVKETMEFRGITILGLAETTGLSSRTVRNARSPKIRQCRLETLATIAGALGVRTKDLYEEKHDEPKSS